MWIDAVGLGLLALFAAFGAWRGAFESGFRLFALGACYGAAVLAVGRSGGVLSESLGIAPWMAGPLIGSAAFLAAWVLCGVGALVIRHADRRRLGGQARPGWDRALGGGFGLARGAVVVLLLGWLGLWIGALRETGLASGLPDPAGAALPALSGRVAESGARAVLGDAPGARLTARLAGHPAETVVGLRKVLEHREIVALQDDLEFWDAVADGRIESALQRHGVRQLSRDAELRETLAGLGVIDEQAARDPQSFLHALGAVLRELAPRLRALREDPELEELAANPEVERLVREGDSLALLGHPGFQRLVARVAASPAAP